MTNNTTALLLTTPLYYYIYITGQDFVSNFFYMCIAKELSFCYDNPRGETMRKIKALRNNKIALCMAVMLMFCAFAAGGELSFDVSFVSEIPDADTAHTTLCRPGAGEFFTGSLPQTEPQSVRETSVHWQELLGSRISAARNDLCVFHGQEVLNQSPENRARSELKKKIPVHHSNAIIVCYIHNKDGQKG